MSTPTSKPRTIIFVPGAYHSTAYYHLVIQILQEINYPGRIVHCQLPSNGAKPGTPAAESMTPDIQTVEAALTEEIVNRKNPVLLIAHSYGSVPAECAIEQFAESGMIKFLIIAGAMLKAGDNLYQYCPESGKPPPGAIVEGDFSFPDESKITLYNGVSDEERKKVISELQWQAIAPCKSPVTFEGWATVPTTYVACTEDQAIPPVVVDFWFQNVKERGVNVERVSIETGHTPMLSQPGRLVEIILGCVR